MSLNLSTTSLGTRNDPSWRGATSRRRHFIALLSPALGRHTIRVPQKTNMIFFFKSGWSLVHSGHGGFPDSLSTVVTVNIHCSQNTLEEPGVPAALLGGSSLPGTSAGDRSSPGASAQEFTWKREKGIYRSGMGIFTLGSISKEVSGNTNIHQSIYACM